MQNPLKLTHTHKKVYKSENSNKKIDYFNEQRCGNMKSFRNEL